LQLYPFALAIFRVWPEYLRVMKKSLPWLSTGSLAHDGKSEKTFFLLTAALFLASSLYWGFSAKGLLPAMTDTLLHVYPNIIINLREWAQGGIPLWNPYWGCGLPQLATWISFCLYPLGWIWNFLGAPGTLVPYCLAHGFLAWVGGCLWLRRQGTCLPGCALGALSFAGSGLAIRCWAYPHHTSAYIWIPWIFWAADRILEKPRLGR
jgi:hypothetical protein